MFLWKRENVKETNIADSVWLSLLVCWNVLLEVCPRPLPPESGSYFMKITTIGIIYFWYLEMKSSM